MTGRGWPGPERVALMNKTRSWAGRLPFFYGWLMLPVVMLVVICTAPGQTYGVSVFNPYLRQALDLSSSQLSGAYMAGTLLAALPLTWIGAMMDRYGARVVLVGVVLLFGLACIGMMQVRGMATLFVAFFFLRLLGQGAMGMLARNTLAMWFSRRLGVASGIANFGAAAAVGGVPALHLWLIETQGWRWAYAFLGLGVWFLLLPLLVFFYRNRPEDLGLRPDGDTAPDPLDKSQEAKAAADTASQKTAQKKGNEAAPFSFTLAQALRTRSFWLAVCGMASWSMSGTGIQFHIVSIFAERGLSAADAAAMFSVYAGVMAFTRLGGGILADRVPLNLIMAAALVFQGIGMVVLNQVEAVWLPVVFGVCFAAGSSLLMAVSETMWVRYYGRLHLGKIRGAVTTIGVGSSSVGPFALGVAYDLSGGYETILWVFVGLALVLSLLSLLATPPAAPVDAGAARPSA
jgi:sugar phosphate permease